MLDMMSHLYSVSFNINASLYPAYITPFPADVFRLLSHYISDDPLLVFLNLKWLLLFNNDFLLAFEHEINLVSSLSLKRY